MPFERVTVPADRAQAREGQVVGMYGEVLVSRPRQQPSAARGRALRVEVPRRAPAGMAQLQAVVERVTHAQQPLTSRLQQDCGVAGGVARGLDGAHPREDLGTELERAQPL